MGMGEGAALPTALTPQHPAAQCKGVGACFGLQCSPAARDFDSPNPWEVTVGQCHLQGQEPRQIRTVRPTATWGPDRFWYSA